MSWIKPNFLWMMYRSGWGSKEGQETTLAVKLKRRGFDEILKQAVHSAYVADIYTSHGDWKKRLAESPVRLQWDPDHDPRGEKQERRAIQLGLAGDILRQYAQDWILSIEDISGFVKEQGIHAESSNFRELLTPEEAVYSIDDPVVAKNIEIEHRTNSLTH